MKSGTEADGNSGVTFGPALALAGIRDFIVIFFFCRPENNGAETAGGAGGEED